VVEGPHLAIGLERPLRVCELDATVSSRHTSNSTPSITSALRLLGAARRGPG